MADVSGTNLETDLTAGGAVIGGPVGAQIGAAAGDIFGGGGSGPGQFTQDPNLEADEKSQVKGWFQEFGYTPTDAEVASLIQLSGAGNADPNSRLAQNQRGESLVAQYVQTIQSVQEANANDPTKQVLADAKGFFNSQQKSAVDLRGNADQVYQQLQKVTTSAPKLFGNLTPDQINEFIAPLRTQFDASDAALQGQANRAGLAGSSTELGLVAQNENAFKENVLSQGVATGLQEQQNEENVLQNRITSLTGSADTALGTLPGALNIESGAASEINANQQNTALLKSQFPGYLTATAGAENASGASAPASDGGNFFDKYVVPFLQPAAAGATKALLT